MRKLLVVSVLLSITFARGQGSAPIRAPIALRGVTVIDATGAAPRPDQTVLIDGNRIVAIGPDKDLRIPRGAEVVEAKGKYLIPGLWDMHTHLTSLGPTALVLNVANGVTGVRDMGAARFAVAKGWRDSIAAGRLLGPRMKIASPIVERADWLAFAIKSYRDAGASTDWATERFGPRSPEEMGRWVDSVVALGADHIKVRNWPNAEIAKALVEGAGQKGIPVVAHANQPFPLSGVASYEHYIFPPLQLSDPARDSLFRKWGASGVAIVPTLVTWPGRLNPVDSLKAWLDPKRTAMYRYIPKATLEDWSKQLDARKAETPFDFQSAFTSAMRDLKEMRAAGMIVLAATDGPGFPPVVGFSLHDELRWLVDSVGMSPLEAIQAATIRPAQFLKLADSLGTVEKGKVADLVLLDANPLADIGNTRTIRAVVVNGKLLDRPTLDRMLAEVEREAGRGGG